MVKLPVISGNKAVKAFRQFGYEIDHQTGSHIILRQNRYPFRRLSVPNHRELRLGTLRALIRQAGISVDEFTAAVRK